MDEFPEKLRTAFNPPLIVYDHLKAYLIAAYWLSQVLLCSANSLFRFTGDKLQGGQVQGLQRAKEGSVPQLKNGISAEDSFCIQNLAIPSTHVCDIFDWKPYTHTVIPLPT